MSKQKNFITDPVSVSVSGRKLLIAFILPMIILAGERIKTDDLVEQENDILDQLKKEESKETPDTNLVDRLKSQLRLPDLLSRYESNGFKSTSFRLVEDDEAAELSVKSSKSDLIAETEELKVQVAGLEALVASQEDALKESEEFFSQFQVAELEAVVASQEAAMKESAEAAKEPDPAIENKSKKKED